ncbi:MAG: hypothetical protein V4648_04365 [Bacteroidota bacterium]
MDLEQKEIVVSQGKRPLWQIIIAAFLYTISLFFIFYFFYLAYEGINNPNLFRGILREFPMCATYAFLGGVSFSLVKTIYINPEKGKLKTELRVGVVKVYHHSSIPQLDYVSIFKHPDSDIFEVNLWYNRNKHYKVAKFEEFQYAFDFGLLFSNKLNIDLLDATEKGNSEWIDKSAL